MHGLTRFSDLTPKEFEEQYLTNKLAKHVARRKFNSDEGEEDISASNEIEKRAVSDSLPQKVDWRINGTVTGVKNQKQCGACWAFVVIENLESMIAIRQGKLEEFSVQELIDCAGNGNEGCNGGDMCTLLSWITENKIKIVREKEYPLKLMNDKCRITKNETGIEVLDYACKR